MGGGGGYNALFNPLLTLNKNSGPDDYEIRLLKWISECKLHV